MTIQWFFYSMNNITMAKINNIRKNVEMDYYQNKIINEINANLDLYGYHNMAYSHIFFYPEKGLFLYNDKFIDYNLILNMIEKKIINFMGIKKHQSINMPCYSLSLNYIKCH